MNKIVSVDLHADLGFLKKPDINDKDSLYLTYNMLHKPAVLGILGAIIGLDGYKQQHKLPEYYHKLKSLKIAIKPLNAKKGLYQKTVLRYNNQVGYASSEGNLMVKEQMLVKPGFRCYLQLDTTLELHARIDEYLRNSHAEYLPYFGKNEFALWWKNYSEHLFKPFKYNQDFSIDSIFQKGDFHLKPRIQQQDDLFGDEIVENYMYFEQLPVGFDEELYQYSYAKFVYTNYIFSRDTRIPNLVDLYADKTIIQLF